MLTLTVSVTVRVSSRRCHQTLEIFETAISYFRIDADSKENCLLFIQSNNIHPDFTHIYATGNPRTYLAHEHSIGDFNASELLRWNINRIARRISRAEERAARTDNAAKCIGFLCWNQRWHTIFVKQHQYDNKADISIIIIIQLQKYKNTKKNRDN